MRAKLYSLSLSHPSHAVRLMLERKGIDHEVANLLPGFHPLLLRAAGFRGGTAPAMRIDGRKVQGSLAIARALEELVPEPPLFPPDPEARSAVEDAERWAEGEFQPVPRRVFRWLVARNGEMRRWMAVEVGMPLPRLMGAANKPLAAYFAHRSGASDDAVRRDLERLPGLLGRVDGLIAAGTIGGEPNAADFQIAATVRVLLAFDDLRPSIENRPAAALAMRLQPDYPGTVPPALPPEWLAPLRRPSQRR